MLSKLICNILGLHHEALMKSEPATQKAYLNSGYALFFVSFCSIFTGIEIALNFTSNIFFVALGGIIGSVVTFCVDYFLLSNSNANFTASISRIIFGIGMVVFSSINIQLFVNHSDITRTLEKKGSEQIDTLDNEYNQTKEARYINLKKLQDANQQYYDSVLQKEALKGFAGEKYNRKKIKYDQDALLIQQEKVRLDSTEQIYLDQYNEKRTELKKGVTTGYYSRIEQLYNLTVRSIARIFMSIVFMLILFGIELSALLAKFSINKDNDYVNYWLPKYSNNQKIINDREIYNELKEILSQIDALNTNKQNVNKHQGKQLRIEELLREENLHIITQIKIRLRQALLRKYGFDFVVNHQTLDKINLLFAKENSQNIFHLSQPMKSIMDKIVSENITEEAISEAVFKWIQENIKYDEEHTKMHYRDAKNTFDNRKGLCGEMAILYIAFLKYARIAAKYLEVDRDCDGKEVNHACIMLYFKSGISHMSDVAYNAYTIQHKSFKIIGDNDLNNNIENLNT